MRSNETRRTRAVLLGYGSINTRVVRLLRQRDSNVDIVGVIVRQHRENLAGVNKDCALITQHDELVALAPDIILEAASREAVREWAPTGLRVARRVVISSSSALVDDTLHRELLALAKQHGSQLVLSPGAIAGVDALAAAARLSLREVRHRIIKSPASWGAAAMPRGGDPNSNGPIILFQGSARTAALRYPLNANVTVVCALASLGLDRTTVELICDPAASKNCHEIYASGDFGAMEIRVSNNPMTTNPKSSELAALSLVRLAENEFASLVL